MPFVYDFDHTHRRPPMEMKDLLGGKGANLAEMTSVLGLPVPHGFTITTDACRAYMDGGWPDGLTAQVTRARARLEKKMGKRLGDSSDPLLVSVRSGAKFSMPGMMDTVLNLGLNDKSVEALARQTDDERFAFDSYRRFVSMYGRIVLDIDGESFDTLLEEAKERCGAKADADVPVGELRALVDAYKKIVRAKTAKAFPQDPADQLAGAIEAVFKSWNGPRAIAYRDHEGISHDLGTAVNVQAMVFGNRDEHSGTGVGFTRDPATGAKGEYGDFLVNAQGEDVVAGIRNTEPLAALKKLFPEVHAELVAIFARLERHYRDMCDTEFTIEQGKLWMLQTRVGKRTGRAALRMAVEMTTDPGIRLTHREAVARVSAENLDQVLHPQFAPAQYAVLTKGLAASPGAAVGRAYFTADDAAAAADKGETRHPGALRDLPRGRARHAGRPGHLDRSRGPRVPRRGRGPGVGQAGRGRGRKGAHQRQVVQGRRRHRVRRGLAVDRRDGGPGGRGRAGAFRRRAPGRVRDGARMGRRHPPGPSQGAGQRRHRGRCRQRRPARGRGHRAVSHRAHVPGRRPAPHRAAHDPGRRSGRGERRSGAVACGAEGRLHRDPGRHGCLTGNGAPPRPSAARVPPRHRRVGDKRGH